MSDRLPFADAVAIVATQRNIGAEASALALRAALALGTIEKCAARKPRLDDIPDLHPEGPDVSTASLMTWLTGTSSSDRAERPKGGRPPGFDWEAYAERFRQEVAERGFPERTNVKGWQRQADVERWLHDLVANDPGAEKRQMSDRTARLAAKKFIEQFRQ